MSKKAAGFLVLAAGVGLAVMAMRSQAAPRVAQKPPYLLDKNTSVYDVPVDSGFTMNWGNRLDDIFAPFYPENNSPWKIEAEKELNNYGVPYAQDTYKSTSGVSPSLFSDAASMIADAGSSIISVVSLPRGIRNNNPGNIRTNGGVSQQPFDGAIPIAQNTDSNKAFMQFENPWYGIRASARVILNYQKNYGLSTIRAMITRYAPPSENNTEAYIAEICRKLGVADNVFYNVQDYTKLAALKKAMIWKENSYEYSNKALFEDACRAAIDNHPCPEAYKNWKVASLLSVLPSYENYV